MTRFTVLALVWGCYLHHGTRDVDFAASALGLVTCNCHHGFGPGADGEVELRADNRSGRTLDLAILEVRYERADGIRMSDAGGVGRGPEFVQPLPPGETQLDLTPYIDFGLDPEAAVGTFRCFVDIELEGNALTIDAGDVEAEYLDVPFG